jgi:hypothetical protein
VITAAPDRPATSTPVSASTEPDAAPARTRLRLLRKAAVAVAGVALILAGIVMMVLPGPGIVAILAGLGLLGTEFPAARRASERLNGYARTAWSKIRRRRDGKPGA